jgi:hypothetical protein
MFDFSTETILNSIAGVSSIGPAVNPTIPVGEVAVRFLKPSMLFYQSNSVGKRKTTAIYKSVGNNPVNEVSTVALASITPADLVGKVVRLAIDVRLDGSEDAAHSRWAVNKGQPYFAEFFVQTTYGSPTLLAAALAPAFNNAMKRIGVSEVVVTASGTNLLVTATNEYQRFDAVNLDLIDNAYEEIPLTIATGSITTPGVQGFGTSWFLTKNLRMPTIEQIRFQGIHQDEKIQANTLYNQYTLVVEAERDITHQGLVGAKATSKTHHVFYVPQGSASAFEAIIDDVASITTVPA